MNFLNNRTWFLIPVTLALIGLLSWGYSETVIKIGSPLAILQFAIAVLMCICFDIYFYFKLKEITKKEVETKLKIMREE